MTDDGTRKTYAELVSEIDQLKGCVANHKYDSQVRCKLAAIDTLEEAANQPYLGMRSRVACRHVIQQLVAQKERIQSTLPASFVA